MTTRTSFRPRPLDITKQLAIVRDLEDLDSADGLVSRDVTHNHEALDKENEEVRSIFCRRAGPVRLARSLSACLDCTSANFGI